MDGKRNGSGTVRSFFRRKGGVDMVNEIAAKEVLCLAFRAVRLGENELERVIKAYLASRGDTPVVHGKMKLKDLMQLDQGAKMMEIAPDAVKGFQRINLLFDFPNGLLFSAYSFDITLIS